jgi:hypothetical protein
MRRSTSKLKTFPVLVNHTVAHVRASRDLTVWSVSFWPSGRRG